MRGPDRDRKKVEPFPKKPLPSAKTCSPMVSLDDYAWEDLGVGKGIREHGWCPGGILSRKVTPQEVQFLEDTFTDLLVCFTHG